MVLDKSFMIFEIHERVQHFKDGQSFNNLSSLELEPIVKVYDTKEKIEVTGYLILSGEFLNKEKERDWREQFDNSDGLHYGTVFFDDENIENFQYQIPVSFEIKKERVVDPSQVFLLVDDFDYYTISDDEIELIAKIKLLGISEIEKSSETKVYDEFKGLTNEEHYDDVSYQNYENKEIRNDFNDEFNANNDYNSDYIEHHGFTKFDVNVSTRNDVEQSAVEKDKEVGEENIWDKLESVSNDVDGSSKIDEEETESKNSQPFEVINREEEKLQEDTTKMKIGIKGRNRDGKVEDKTEVGMKNPLYSLIKKEKNDQKQPLNKAEEKVSKQDANILLKSDEADYDSSVNDSNNLASNETNLNEKDTEITLILENNPSEEEPSAKRTIGQNSTKEMLFSLLKNDEENKYKFKIYFVKKNDTLESIADRYELKVSCLTKYNNLSNDRLEEGQLLYLPDKRMIKNNEH